MTLHRRFLLQNLLLVVGLIAAGGVLVWRLGIVRGEVDLSHNVYAELRNVVNVGVDVGIVRGLLSEPRSDRAAVVTHLRYAIGGLDQFIQVGQGYGTDGTGGADRSDAGAVMRDAYVPINRSAAAARGRLQALLDRFTAGGPAVSGSAVSGSAVTGTAGTPGTRGDADDPRRTVDLAMRDLDQVASSCIRFISDRQQAASGDLAATLVLAGLLSLAAVSAAVFLSASQYRMVVTPLRRLRRGVLRIAEAQFTQTLDAREMGRSAEFLDLAAQFNRMARDLDEFYRRLEQQVRARSRELVRSERLASVGFLAAGVAHEINNPLHIISGYAELTARRLEPARGPLDAAATADARQSLQIIRDEAFRCKEVTERLLDLARNGSESREPLDLAGVARDVAAMTRGLKNYQDRRVTLKMEPGQSLEVRANQAEMKQVLLNLTLNALEAAPPVRGEVCIEGRRGGDWVELSVADNGRGMAPEVLRHVFEPFFTARRPATGGRTEGGRECDGRDGPNGCDGGVRRDERGTGLGLSITHAIVENHGGRILAESDGPGRGARFTVRLPAGPVGPARRAGRGEWVPA